MTWGVPSRVEALETCSGFLCGEVIGSEGGRKGGRRGRRGRALVLSMRGTRMGNICG